MINFKKYWIKYRYSNLLRLFFDILSKIGLRISFYYTFKKTVSLEDLPTGSEGFDDYELSFWGAEEMKAMALIPDREASEEKLLKRLNEGSKCLGLKKNNQIAGFCWFDFKELHIECHRAPLKKNEIFLFDIYTLMEYRGKGLATFLIFQLYKKLNQFDRTLLFSYADYFNTPGVKLKLRLTAKKDTLNLYIGLFKKWFFLFILKKFQK